MRMSPEPLQVVVLGVFATDLVFRAGRLPHIGETLLGETFDIGAGGKGSNQAIAAARAGARTGLISRIGADMFAKLARTTWERAGVVQDMVAVDPCLPTGAAFVFVSTATGENAIIIAAGAAAAISPADIAAVEPAIATAGVFITQLEQPVIAAEAGLAMARRHGVTTILNPAPVVAVPETIWRLCDWVTPNETEASMLTGIEVTDLRSAAAAAAALVGRGARNVLMTLGERGALLIGERLVGIFPPLEQAQIVDTTGAGDAFNAGLAVALAERRELSDAVRFAMATAGLSVGRSGAAASMPTRSEIDAAFGRTRTAAPLPEFG